MNDTTFAGQAIFSNASSSGIGRTTTRSLEKLGEHMLV
jgi:hypothetical protein